VIQINPKKYGGPFHPKSKPIKIVKLLETALDGVLQNLHRKGLHNCLRGLGLHLHFLSEHHPHATCPNLKKSSKMGGMFTIPKW
jgi:hypothetical protein